MIDILSFRPKWRMERAGTSDMDGKAARAAVRESGDERFKSLAILPPANAGEKSEMSRLRST